MLSGDSHSSLFFLIIWLLFYSFCTVVCLYCFAGIEAINGRPEERFEILNIHFPNKDIKTLITLILNCHRIDIVGVCTNDLIDLLLTNDCNKPDILPHLPTAVCWLLLTYNKRFHRVSTQIGNLLIVAVNCMLPVLLHQCTLGTLGLMNNVSKLQNEHNLYQLVNRLLEDNTHLSTVARTLLTAIGHFMKLFSQLQDGKRLGSLADMKPQKAKDDTTICGMMIQLKKLSSQVKT